MPHLAPVSEPSRALGEYSDQGGAHTPSPMAFPNDICGRPENEKPYILLACGYPAENCVVPQSGGVRRPLVEAVTWL